MTDRWRDILDPLPLHLGPLTGDEPGESSTAAQEPPSVSPVVPRRRFLQRALWIGGGAMVGAGATAAGFMVAARRDDRAEANAALNLGPLIELRDRLGRTVDPMVIDDRGPVVYLALFPDQLVPSALTVYPPELHDGIRVGLVAVVARSPHLGCRVEWCASSGWFEDPCHASAFNSYGLKKSGPSPRGLDHHPVRVSPSWDVIVDRSALIPGLPLDVTFDDDGPRGPRCVG
jgi:cytochrome b6-f complex iron-sulfur subunit